MMRFFKIMQQYLKSLELTIKLLKGLGTILVRLTLQNMKNVLRKLHRFKTDCIH